MTGEVSRHLGRFLEMKILMMLVVVVATTLQSISAVDVPILGFYVVSNEPKPGLHHFSSATFPNLGYIADRPDLKVTHIKNVHVERTLQRSKAIHQDGSSETTEDYPPNLIIEFLQEDIKVLRDLTNNHLGEQVLLMLGAEPLCAPVIRTRMDEPSIAISLPPGIDPDKIKTKLEKLCEQKR